MDVITRLACPNCGAPLSVAQVASRAQCLYCQAEHLVHREAGHVTLEDLAYIRATSDRTASELALQRLTGEVRDLKGQRERIYSQANQAIAAYTQKANSGIQKLALGGIIFVGLALVSIALSTGPKPSTVAGCACLLSFFGAIPVALGLIQWLPARSAIANIKAQSSAALAPIEQEIVKHNQEMARHKQIVSP